MLNLNLNNQQHQTYQKKAFSLVELSIILIIVGLLVAVVTGGGKLSTAAKKRAFINELSQIRTAHMAFITSYGKAAGDLNYASTYFNDAACPAGNAPTGCNGDGDGTVDIVTESYRYWQHLALAKVMSGDFTGVEDAGWPKTTKANSYESTSYKGALFFPSGTGNWILWMDHTDAHDYMHIELSTIDYYGSTIGFISPRDLESIDKKFDDGAPAIGLLIGMAFTNSGSASGIGGNYCTTLNNIGSASKATRHASTYNIAFN